MNKLVFTLAAVLLYQVLPLLGAPELLLHWKMLVTMAAAGTLWLSQPAIRPGEASSNRSSDRNTVWLILVMAGVSTIVPELEWAYGNRPVAGNPYWNAAGLSLLAGGVAFRLWAIRTLGRFFTSTVQTSQEQALVTAGPYTIVRHPSYLGAYVAILGISVLFQAWIGLATAAAAMYFAYYQRIAAEESALRAQFGDHYIRYGLGLKKMLPGIW
jgi:protein-S-isoprenylcysteine O-methyltransferase Ste14